MKECNRNIHIEIHLQFLFHTMLRNTKWHSQIEKLLNSFSFIAKKKTKIVKGKKIFGKC